MRKQFLYLTIFSLAAFGFGILGAYTFFSFHKQEVSFLTGQEVPLSPVSFNGGNVQNDPGFNFVEASNRSKPAVVFINGIREGMNQGYWGWDMFFDFFSTPMPSIQSGSGVIISSDGYIVTNNHVIKDADRLEVKVINHKKSYPATIIGTDPASDLALLKIEVQNLPAIEFAKSDLLQVGDWVVAVGNPFNLMSTVTSGIVSAKGRNINIVKNNFPIESFIQTDAAINAGNSGGALVDVKGRLVGINTAILSQTGSYAGYGFAIPSNIVRKIVDDLKNFSVVQRAFIEADITDIDDNLARKIGKEDIQGVYVKEVYENSNASGAGLIAGDVIIKANGVKILSRSEFDEQLAYLRPGDILKLEVIRNDKIMIFDIKVTNSEGNTQINKNTMVTSVALGASFSNITKMDKEYYGIENGIKVTNIKKGLISQLGLPDGFIILQVNSQKFDSADKLIETLVNVKGWLMVRGITPEGWLITRSIHIY
jgi:Do/DeqQ family serine protease